MQRITDGDSAIQVNSAPKQLTTQNRILAEARASHLQNKQDNPANSLYLEKEITGNMNCWSGMSKRKHTFHIFHVDIDLKPTAK